MPEMEKGLFSGTDQPLATDRATLFITSLEKQQIEELFETHGWEGEASEAVGLRLSPDNTRVQVARLLIAGAVGQRTDSNPSPEEMADSSGTPATRSLTGGHKHLQVPRRRNGQRLRGKRVHQARDNDSWPRQVKAGSRRILPTGHLLHGEIHQH
jgi:hypothetical protein